MWYQFGISLESEVDNDKAKIHEHSVSLSGLNVPSKDNLIVKFCAEQWTRDAVLNAKSKQMGMLSELLVKERFSADISQSPTNAHDFMYDGRRLEVKSSRAIDTNKWRRLVKSSDLANNHSYNCNIQQVKPEFFDVLVYIIYTHDKVMIFLILSEDITSDNIRYSDKQHRNNIGEGQFHINSNTFPLHLPLYVEELTYNDVYKYLMNTKEGSNMLKKLNKPETN